MNLTVNNTTLNVLSAYTERKSGGVVEMYVSVPYSEMDGAELKELFKGNTEDMVLVDGEQEMVFPAALAYKRTIDNDTSEIYTVVMGSDENEFQLGRNRQLEADKASLESTVSSKNMEISELNGTISEKDKTIEEKEVVITEQAETITALEATIASKDGEIAELLTIAEEYADMLYAEALEEIEAESVVEESEVM